MIIPIWLIIIVCILALPGVYLCAGFLLVAMLDATTNINTGLTKPWARGMGWAVIGGLVVLLLCALSHAAEVRIATHCYKPGGTTPIVTVHVGHDFDLAVTVQDLRPAGFYYNPYSGETLPLIRGAYSAYVDVVYPKKLVEIKSQPQFGAYSSKTAWLYNRGRISDLGGISSGWGGFGNDPVELARVRMRARKAGMATFQPDSVTQHKSHPYDDTAMFGNDLASPPEFSRALLPSDIETMSATLRIQP